MSTPKSWSWEVNITGKKVESTTLHHGERVCLDSGLVGTVSHVDLHHRGDCDIAVYVENLTWPDGGPADPSTCVVYPSAIVG